MNACPELSLKAATQPFSRFVSLDPGPCRLKGGGGKKCIYVAAGLEKGGDAGQKGGVECTLWMNLVGA
jgi:hypothetical protein